ncbi:MAG: FlxA-like family protein [Marinisporobacter sp.]|jgi:alanyl-tRNA synthetase|nr:FlxA-like family protein [Marinisporobacter sp.]
MKVSSMMSSKFTGLNVNNKFKGQLSLKSVNGNNRNANSQKNNTLKRLLEKKKQLQKKLMEIDKQKISAEEKEKHKKSIQEEIKGIDLQIQQIKSPKTSKIKGTKIDTLV